MRRSDIDYNQDEIKRLLTIDRLDRNKNLRAMMKFLATIDGQFVMNLDDSWGAGKTVFLKQLEYIANHKEHDESIEGISSDEIVDFKEHIEVVYYNAWEHDLYNTPLESLLYNLLMYFANIDNEKMQGEKVRKDVTKVLKNMGMIGIGMTIKQIAGGIIEFMEEACTEKNPVSTITSIDKKRELINELVGILLEGSDKRILIIIDELDRCKPTYAVEMLEIIKHFFNESNIIFMFGSNKKELSETIKKQYGNNFDGFKYLNRFFDFEFKLPKVDLKKYIETKYQCFEWSDFFSWQGTNLIETCIFFDFTMRDTDRYMTICEQCQKFWTSPGNRYFKDLFIEHAILPYMIGLRLYSGEEYKEFINKNGLDRFIEFFRKNEAQNNRMLDIGRGECEEIELEDRVTNVYYEFCGCIRNEKVDGVSDSVRTAIENINDVLTMMSDYTVE